MNSNRKFVILLEILVIAFLVMSVVPVCGLSDSSADISAYPSIVNPGDEIIVTFSGAPGFELDWIAMYKVGDPNEEEYDMGYYLAGEKSGTLSFTAPDEPGDYEFRLFEDDGYTDIARSNVVTVQAGTTVPTPTPTALSSVHHLGDQTLSDWEVPKPEGTEYTTTFSLTAVPASADLILDVFDTDYNNLVLVNGNSVCILCINTIESWKQCTIKIPGSALRVGSNTLTIQSESRGGNYDDFMIRNIGITPSSDAQPTTPTPTTLSGVHHLGDQTLSDWEVPKSEGTEYTTTFSLTAVPASADLILDVFDTDYNNPVLVNGNSVGILCINTIEGWKQCTIKIPGSALRVGSNTLTIQSESRGGNYDDFIIRNIGVTGTIQEKSDNFNHIVAQPAPQKVLIGQNLQFDGFDGTVAIYGLVSGDIANVYQTDANNRIYNVNWPMSGAFYVNYDSTANTYDAQLSVEEPDMPLVLKVGTKEVSSITVGTNLIIDTRGMNLYPEDQVDLVVIGPDGQIEHDEVNDQQFTDITVDYLTSNYGDADNTLETAGWTIGAYICWVKTDSEYACGLDAVSNRKELVIIKGAVSIEAVKTSAVELETVKLIVTGVAGDEINVAASPLSDDVVFKAGIDDTPTNAGCEFEDKIDSDGIRKYAVEFNNKGIYRIKVTVIDGPRKGDSDTEDITVSEKEMPLDLPAPIPPEGGLVGYWNFNEGSGNIAYDSSGSGNDRTIHGATWVDNGSCKEALSFDGVDDYVETNPATFQSNDITVEAWIYPKSFSSYKNILHKGDRIGANNFLFVLLLNSNKIRFDISSNGNHCDSIVGATNLELKKWYHVVGVYRSSDKFYAVYVNGTEDNSKTATLSSLYHDASKYWIGARYDNRQFVSGRYFNGIIDEVRIYDRALSEEEIRADMNECAPMPTSIDHAEAPVTVLTSSTILPTAGGLLTVESEDNELNGASLDIPARALTNNVTISIATTETLPSGSPFGQVPVGKLFVLLPSNLTFSEPVTLTLPIPAGEERQGLYIGRWDDKNKIWENIGGTIDGDFIATNISLTSFYGLFYTGKSTVEIVNRQQLDTSDLPITVMYVAGPVPPPDTPDQSYFRATRPLPAGGVKLKQDESRIMQLLPGRYHFLVSYPRPQPGVANSMWFTIPVLTEGADDGQIDQTIAIRDYGADSTNSYTNDSIMFPGRTVVESTNFRPVVNCNAIVPEGVPLLGTNQILNIGPIKIEQLQDEGITLSATVTDPEGSALKYYWTVPKGVSIGCFTTGTTASGSTLTAQFKTGRAGLYTTYLTVYDQYGLFNEGRWVILVSPNAKPYIDVVVDDVVIDFGRLDDKRRNFGVGPAPGLPRNHPVPFPNVNFLPTPGIPNWGVYSAPPVPGEINASTELKRLPIIDDDARPNITAHFNPSQYPGGMTCVYAIVADADGDAIEAEFVLPTPLFGRGNMYTAIPIPNATNPITSEIELSDGKTLAESFPDGYPIGAILDNYKVMEAYNAILTEYANRGWLPVQPHNGSQFGGLVAPIESLRTPPREFPYVIGFNQGGIRNGSIYPEDIVTEAPNPLGLIPQGTVFKVIVAEGSWTDGDAKGYLWMVPVTGDFWDQRHSTTAVPALFVNNVRKATCSYVGQTLPVIWEAPDDPDVEQTTHDRRHVFDPSTIISRGGTVNIEARVEDPFSPQERAFGLVAWPTPTSMEEEEEEDTSDGEFNCPIPNEAKHIGKELVGFEDYWEMPDGKVVGPYQTWYDEEKTKKRSFSCYNAEGKLQVFKRWYEDGTLKKECHYKDDKFHGVYKVWRDDGTPYIDENYKEGKKHGVTKIWYEDGTLKEECHYKDGRKHGVCKTWREDGTPKYERNYKDGKKHGVYKEWREDGTPKYERNYKDGKKHGVCKEWTVNGKLLYECNYEDGKKHGVSKWWYDDGTPEYEWNYKDGKLHGVSKWWYGDGTPKYERNYKDGKLHGVSKWWYGDGTPKYERNYKDGKKHGVCKTWSVNGKLIRECNYEESKCVSCVHGHC